MLVEGFREWASEPVAHERSIQGVWQGETRTPSRMGAVSIRTKAARWVGLRSKGFGRRSSESPTSEKRNGGTAAVRQEAVNDTNILVAR